MKQSIETQLELASKGQMIWPEYPLAVFKRFADCCVVSLLDRMHKKTIIPGEPEPEHTEAASEFIKNASILFDEEPETITYGELARKLCSCFLFGSLGRDPDEFEEDFQTAQLYFGLFADFLVCIDGYVYKFQWEGLSNEEARRKTKDFMHVLVDLLTLTPRDYVSAIKGMEFPMTSSYKTKVKKMVFDAAKRLPKERRVFAGVYKELIPIIMRGGSTDCFIDEEWTRGPDIFGSARNLCLLLLLPISIASSTGNKSTHNF